MKLRDLLVALARCESLDQEISVTIHRRDADNIGIEMAVVPIHRVSVDDSLWVEERDIKFTPRP